MSLWLEILIVVIIIVPLAFYMRHLTREAIKDIRENHESRLQDIEAHLGQRFLDSQAGDPKKSKR